MTSDPPTPAGSYVGFSEHRLRAGEGFERAPDDREVAPSSSWRARSALDAAGRRYPSLGSRTSVFEGPPAPVLLLAPGTGFERPRGDGGDRRRRRRAGCRDPGWTPARRPPTRSSWRRAAKDPRSGASTTCCRRPRTRAGSSSSRSSRRAATGRATRPTSTTPRTRRARHTSRSSTTTASPGRRAGPSPASTRRTGQPRRVLVPRDGDVVLVPRGYHPVAAAPGYDAYYLNVMAGPHRAWHFSLDSDHAWLMDWDPQAALTRRPGREERP